MFEGITDKLAQINLIKKVFPEVFENKVNPPTVNSPEEFYAAFVDLDPKKTKITETVLYEDIYKIYDTVEDIDVANIINLKKLNDVCEPEEFLEAISKKLPLKGKFICHAETVEQRYKRIINKYPRVISGPLYILDFIIWRLLPKWRFSKKLFLLLTKGKNKAFSLAQILGLFAYYGFTVNYLKDINDITYFAFEKVKIPCIDCKPSSGIIFRMDRVGKGGRVIKLYKLRTMHPYSEYIQQFVYDLNGSQNGDKLNNDFRVASWGRVFRKYWIDELPMLINWLKGEIKLVGVRPLSLCKFNMYPEELQQLRISCKPGLIPPFYADLPKTFDELLLSEKKYLLAYKNNPIKTDVKYFFQCIYNILIKSARSA
ncbi:MAG: sugar transferase [Bacillota bacterium]